MPHKMVYVCSHRSRVVSDKFGTNCENSMFFARDGGFSQVTTYGCIFGTFRYHIWTQHTKSTQNTCVFGHFLNKNFPITPKNFPFAYRQIFENFEEFFISKCQNVMFPRRNFAQKDDSPHLKSLKWLTFAKKAKWVPEMSKFWQNLTFQCPFSVSPNLVQIMI